MSKKENKSRIYITNTKIKDYEKSNYLKKANKILTDLNAFDGAPGIYHMKIEHDNWCDINKQKACNCNPNVSKINDAEGMSLLKGKLDE